MKNIFKSLFLSVAITASCLLLYMGVTYLGSIIPNSFVLWLYENKEEFSVLSSIFIVSNTVIFARLSKQTMIENKGENIE